MDNKSFLRVEKAGTAVPVQARRGNASLSLLQARLQVTAGRPLNVLRMPPLPQNRAYLKTLREAEPLTWTAADKDRRAAPIPASRNTLPKVQSRTGEGHLYALLAVLCVVALLRELVSLLPASAGWHDFVELVRQLLA